MNRVLDVAQWATPQSRQMLKAMVRCRGWVDAPSTGQSMFPCIREGDVCRFSVVDVRHLKRGDIVLFVSKEERLIGHRFKERASQDGRTMYTFKGDTNLYPDAGIPEDNVIGVLREIRRNGRVIRCDSLFRKVWGNLFLAWPILTVGTRSYLKWMGICREKVRVRRRS